VANPTVIAHRGASAAHPPGNTVAALAAAGPLGATWVELDVRRTADGVLAVHHDPHTADGLLLGAAAFADLPDDIPNLDAALDACRGLGVNVEIKNSPEEPDFDRSLTAAAQVVDVLRRRNGTQPTDFLVSSFHFDTIERVHDLDPDLPTAFLVIAPEPELLERAAAGGHAAVHPWHGLVNAETMALARQLGLQVNVWTVDEPDQIRSLAALGVDGVVTNVPDVAVATLAGTSSG
jgi:glycerophosphoryl diester phosphodiesterase